MENRSWVTERMAFVVRKSMKTADDVYDAMLSRGFTGRDAVPRPPAHGPPRLGLGASVPAGAAPGRLVGPGDAMPQEHRLPAGRRAPRVPPRVAALRRRST